MAKKKGAMGLPDIMYGKNVLFCLFLGIVWTIASFVNNEWWVLKVLGILLTVVSALRLIENIQNGDFRKKEKGKSMTKFFAEVQEQRKSKKK